MEALQTGLRSLFRILIFLFSLLAFLVSAFAIHLVTKNPDQRKRRFSAHATWWARLICRLFRIRVVVTNPPPKDLAGLVVGNHLGFIDILACSSVHPNLFVTSKEMRETPVLGLITEMGGCIYVERRSRLNIVKELGQITEHLKKGFRVVLYPEATSTNGETVLPFKRTLITAAAQAGVPVIPYVFNFREVNGEPGFPLKYRDSICWYGDISFQQAIWRAFGLKSLVCEMEFLSPVYTKTDDDRATVADALHEMILDKYSPPVELRLSQARSPAF